MDVRLSLRASNKSEKSDVSDEETSSTDKETNSKGKNKLIINKENTLNAVILSCLRMVLTQQSIFHQMI